MMMHHHKKASHALTPTHTQKQALNHKEPTIID